MGSGITRLPFVAAQYPGNICWAMSEHSLLTNMHHQLFPVHFRVPRTRRDIWYFWVDGVLMVTIVLTQIRQAYLSSTYPCTRPFEKLTSCLSSRVRGKVLRWPIRSFIEMTKRSHQGEYGAICVYQKNAMCWITSISVDIKIKQLKTKDDVYCGTAQNWADIR